jgi:hypothetical protein
VSGVTVNLELGLFNDVLLHRVPQIVIFKPAGETPKFFGPKECRKSKKV